jgi:hypothetical protein
VFRVFTFAKNDQRSTLKERLKIKDKSKKTKGKSKKVKVKRLNGNLEQTF